MDDTSRGIVQEGLSSVRVDIRGVVTWLDCQRRRRSRRTIEGSAIGLDHGIGSDEYGDFEVDFQQIAGRGHGGVGPWSRLIDRHEVHLGLHVGRSVEDKGRIRLGIVRSSQD